MFCIITLYNIFLCNFCTAFSCNTFYSTIVSCTAFPVQHSFYIILPSSSCCTAFHVHVTLQQFSVQDSIAYRHPWPPTSRGLYCRLGSMEAGSSRVSRYAHCVLALGELFFTGNWSALHNDILCTIFYRTTFPCTMSYLYNIFLYSVFSVQHSPAQKFHYTTNPVQHFLYIVLLYTIPST